MNNQLAFKDFFLHFEKQDGDHNRLSYNHCFQTFSGEINHYKRLFYKLYLQHLCTRLCRHGCFFSFHPLIFHNMNSLKNLSRWIHSCIWSQMHAFVHKCVRVLVKSCHFFHETTCSKVFHWYKDAVKIW